MSKNNFYKELKSIFQNEINFEDEFPFLKISEYSKSINHFNFVIYEDWWINKPEIILSKIKSKLGLSERIFARKTTVKKLDKLTADSFLNNNHIYGTTLSKHKLGLYYKKELVAVTTFSMQRNLNIGRSAELIRFCSKNGTTVIGGLDKLIKFYEKEYQPDHIMSYIDKDWGKGDSFLKIGFIKTSERAIIQFSVDSETGRRTLIKDGTKNHKITIANRGGIKVEKHCK